MTCKERRLLNQAVKHLKNIDQKRFGYVDCLEWKTAMKKIDEIFKEDKKPHSLELKDATLVAKTDNLIGVSSAIETLESMGFDCSYYWQTMAQVEDVDEDDMNLKTRDELYKRLGIYNIMQDAYRRWDK